MPEAKSNRYAIYMKLVQYEERLPNPDDIPERNWHRNLPDTPLVSRATIEKRFVNGASTERGSNIAAKHFGERLSEEGCVADMLYCPISQKTDYCFVKGVCACSTHSNAARHAVWVILNKRQRNVCEAYCCCSAGLPGRCKHVAALLFAVLAQWKKSYDRRVTKQSVVRTRRRCEMNSHFVSFADIKQRMVEPPSKERRRRRKYAELDSEPSDVCWDHYSIERLRRARTARRMGISSD